MSVFIEASGFPALADYIDRLPEISAKSMLLAINQTAERKAIPLAREVMSTQVDFPKGYLNQDRLSITKKATSNDLEAIISGRDRPTSLARFVVGAPLPGKASGGVVVRVKPGKETVLRKAFLVTLRNGNQGVAVRLAPGDSLRNSQGAKRLANDVYLLYGPSVEQIFRDVAGQITDPIGDYLADEFLRQFARLSGE